MSLVRAKQRVIWALRHLRLLRAADALLFAVHCLKEAPANRAFRLEHPGSTWPSRRLAFETCGHVHLRTYWSSGRRHAQLFAEIIGREFGNQSIRVLEWGCGPGRILRHLASFLEPDRLALFGSDVSGESIRWCQESLPGIRFVKNDPLPPLPFEAGSFDVACSFSVLTHLAEPTQRLWVQELRRILRPGGMVILTTHGEHYRPLLLPREARRFDSGMVVTRGGIPEGSKHFLAFHPPAAVRELLEGFEEVRQIPSPLEYDLPQDVWVARA